MVDVPQALSASAPIEEVIARLNLIVRQTNALPGLNARGQFRAIQKLPLRVEKQTVRGEQAVHVL